MLPERGGVNPATGLVFSLTVSKKYRLCAHVNSRSDATIVNRLKHVDSTFFGGDPLTSEKKIFAYFVLKLS